MRAATSPYLEQPRRSLEQVLQERENAPESRDRKHAAACRPKPDSDSEIPPRRVPRILSK